MPPPTFSDPLTHIETLLTGRFVEPFRIICETCRSRLKIRSPEVIGQIHECPKCGSMVLIQPPAGWSPNSPSTAAATTASSNGLSLSTGASIIIPAAAAGELPSAPPVASPAELANANFSSAELPASMPTANGSTNEVAPALAETAKISVPWFTLAAGAAAIGMAAGLLWVIWPSHNDPPTANPPQLSPVKSSATGEPQKSNPATSPPAPTVPAPAPSVATKSVAVSASPSTLPLKPTVAQPAEPKEKQEAIAKLSASPLPEPANANSPRVAQAQPKANAPSAEPPKNQSAAPAIPPESEPIAADHAPVLKFDPLNFDPDRLSTKSESPTESAAATPTPDQPLADIPAPAIPSHDKVPVAPASNHPPVAKATISVRRGPADEPAKPGKRFATIVPDIRGNMPLGRAISLLANIAGSAVTIDPMALELAGVSLQTEVKLDGQNVTVRDELNGICTSLGLSFIDQAEQPRIVLPKATEVRKVDADMHDLAAHGDAANVAQLIEHFVVPTSWKTGGGAGILEPHAATLHIEQSVAVGRQAMIFCERLRHARGLTLRTKYPPALASAEPAYQQLATRLNSKTTFTFLPWTRLADVVHQWEELTGLTILVDWNALAERDLDPSSGIACSAIDHTWSESLDGILEPLGLTWWAVNGDTLQITTRDASEKIQRVEFYELPPAVKSEFASDGALLDSLQKELAELTTKTGKPAPLHLELDGPSGRLIVLANPIAHRYLGERLRRKPK